MRILVAGAVLLPALGVPLRAAPEAPPSRTPARASSTPAAVKASAGELMLTLQRVSLRRTAVLSLGPSERPLPGQTREEAEATLEFTLEARDAEALDRVVPGASSAEARYRVLDNRGQAAGPVRAELLRTEERPQVHIRVAGLSPRATGLSLLEGELLAYPRARRIRFHIPWLKDETPLRVEFGGGAATLKGFRLVGDDSTLTVAVRPPDGYRLAPLEQQGALIARALDIYGNLVNGGGIARIEQTGFDAEPEFQFFAPGLRRIPSRLMLDLLCVLGEPQPLRFRFRGLAFPAPVR
jgi:hypothetical protein